MKTIDEMGFYTEVRRDCRFVGRVREFPNLRTKPRHAAMDAITDIVRMTAERLQDIHESQSINAIGGRPA